MPLDDSQTPDQAAAIAPTGNDPWPEIDRRLFDEARPAPVPFPLELLPGRWRAWVEASAQAFTPVDYLAQGLFSAVAAVGGGGIVVQATAQWSEPLVLWQALVGGPSSGKSPALAAARRLLLDDREPEPAGKPDADGDTADGWQVPAVFVDHSLRELAGALTRSPRAVTLWRDELGEWMAEAGRGRDRAGWLAGWHGGEIIARQSGYWPQTMARFPVGIVGALRPERLADAFAEGEDGLATRFLYAWPEATSCAALGGPPADDAGVRAMLRRISKLAAHTETPGRLPLGPKAVAALEKILPELRAAMRQADDGAEAGFIGKGAGTIVRLAGLLALMRWAEDETTELPDGIAPRQLAQAHALWSGYFLPHAQSVFRRAGTADGSDRLARRAARWLRRSRLRQVSREDIRREALARAVDAEGAEEVIARLETGGVLRSLAPERIGGRGPARRRWEVNPELLGNSGNSAGPPTHFMGARHQGGDYSAASGAHDS